MAEAALTNTGAGSPSASPPLVKPRPGGARQRLRGPPDSLAEEFASFLRPEPTTVTEDGGIRFGDSLLLLSHDTEVPLQADVSHKEQVVDDSHSQRKEFTAIRLTTAKVLHPCPRNTFSLARAARKDSFPEDDLHVHLGQEVRLVASSSCAGSQLLHLHLKEPAQDGPARSTPVLLPRTASRTAWRVVPSPAAFQGQQAGDGRVVKVNESIALENVETGRLLMSTADLGVIRNAFGAECGVFAEDIGQRPKEEDVRKATWSFVNETWADAVAALEKHRTGGVVWKEDQGDDFAAGLKAAPVEEEEDFLPAFRPLAGNERLELEERLALLRGNPKARIVAERILPAMRSQGVHSARKFRRSCVCTDVLKTGTVAVHAFKGLLCNLVVRLTPPEFADLYEAFAVFNPPDSIDYGLLFQFMKGILPEPRLRTLHRAYRRLQRASAGQHVTVGTLMKLWNPRCYPGVLSADDVKEARVEFASQWEVLHHDGEVEPEDFLEYYSDISIYYVDSADFIEMLRVAWDL